jgi:hypothetical protein
MYMVKRWRLYISFDEAVKLWYAEVEPLLPPEHRRRAIREAAA